VPSDNQSNDKLVQVSEKQGFFAALDQSGGSTPGALKLYGIPESRGPRLIEAILD